MEWPGLSYVQKALLKTRYRNNQNNLTRTNYYYKYWKQHPEVPWALMANLVSRNAGYQMTDLDRYYKLSMGGLSPLLILPGLAVSPVLLFALLEAGNFLIFRDVCPSLEAYAWSKLFPYYTTAIFNLLIKPEFNADPFIVSTWVDFAEQAGEADWLINWADDDQQHALVRRHTFALVVNEQNQIEDRLVNPSGVSRFLPFLTNVANLLILMANWFGQTRLCFMLGASEAEQQERLLLYQVSDFLSLDGRINTGRSIFYNLFEEGTERRQRVEAWVHRHPQHTASRSDYNPTNFSTHISALSLPGQIYYSPHLKQAWPPTPELTKLYGHIHRQPEPLPIPVAARPYYQRWLEPLSSPTLVQSSQFVDLEEILDDDVGKLPQTLLRYLTP